MKKIIIILIFLSLLFSTIGIFGYEWIPISCPDMNKVNRVSSLIALLFSIIPLIYFFIKKPRWALISFLSLFLGVISLLSQAGCVPVQRDLRIYAAIEGSGAVMDSAYRQENNYLNFDCKHLDMTRLCQEIYNQSGQNPIILKDDSLQEALIFSPATERKGFWVCADSNKRVGWTEIDPFLYFTNTKSVVCPSLIGERGAEETVLQFYNCYLDNFKEPFEKRIAVCDFLEKSFRERILALQKRIVLGDVVLGVSDWYDESYTEIVSQKGNSFIVTFPPIFSYHEIKVDVAFIDQEWRITNIALNQE